MTYKDNFCQREVLIWFEELNLSQHTHTTSPPAMRVNISVAH